MTVLWIPVLRVAVLRVTMLRVSMLRVTVRVAMRLTVRVGGMMWRSMMSVVVSRLGMLLVVMSLVLLTVFVVTAILDFAHSRKRSRVMAFRLVMCKSLRNLVRADR